MNNLISRIIGFVKKTNIYVLVNLAVFIPILILIGWIFVAIWLFEGDVPLKYTALVVACCMFISSLGGIVQIIKKESPGLLGISFKGSFPVLAGILWVLVSWFFSLYSIYYVIFGR